MTIVFLLDARGASRGAGGGIRYPVAPGLAALAVLALAAVAPAGCSAPPDQDIEPDAAGSAAELRRGEPTPFEGYTLFAPLRSTTIYLVDMDGELAHSWETEYNGGSLYMLESGTVLRSIREPDPVGPFRGGGEGGIVQEIAWDGTVRWELTYSTMEYRQHHDLAPMPNGNVLLIAWEGKTREEAESAGINPARLDGDEIWPDWVVEIEPVRPDGGNVVWEWHAWDHLVQEHDPSKANYGVVAEHPELIDLNAAPAHRQRQALATPESEQRLRALGYLGGGSGADNRHEIGRD